jgi:D-alanyl-D-alanine carboxypeptidase
VNDISIGIFKIFYNKPYEIPSLKDVEVDQEILKQYEGVYSSKDLPIKLTIKADGKKLTAQGTGQPVFPLDPVSNTEFTFAQAGVAISFDQEKNILVLKQGGKEFTMSRE